MNLFNNASMMPIDEFQKRSVVESLKKMFRNSYFDICTVDACCKILNIHPPREIYNALHALHCVHWSDMDEGFRNEVFARTLEIFKTSSFDLSRVNVVNLFPENKTGKKVYKMLEA